MKVTYISNFRKFKDQNLSVALGFFDGFHLGHLSVLKNALEYAKDNDVESALITFNESAYSYINKLNQANLLSVNDKIDYAKELGFDSIYIIELTDEFIKLTKDEFIEIFLKDQAHIVVGFDYTFGYKGLGNSEYLTQVLGSKVSVIDKKEIDGEKISTSLIKRYLDDGELSCAINILGKPYTLEGSISRINKYHRMITDYYLPRSGEYELKLTGDGYDITFKAKLKSKREEHEILIKTSNEDFISIPFKKHNRFKLTLLARIVEN